MRSNTNHKPRFVLDATGLHEAIEVTVASVDFGVATARKAGRNPRWPYVPVIRYNDRPLAPTTQIKGLAYETRDEAVAAAQQTIDHQRAVLAEKLAQPQYRALRERYGLPTHLPKEAS